ncbi:hypothetical protein KIPE111705_22080 [Kibdelosporangium persicum]|uniref:Mce-associated membrane protein n=1 Tax=Kibdelosporangium persicum TaxID=2698649 RepID=A0ABX2FDK0_9PSEU|nr:hypothetical protein [Kibdelosporangium persicum]NRN69445.1 hypothetical protein [Kibdelosporangium persicum]
MRHKGLVPTATRRWLDSVSLAVLVPAMAFGLAACSSTVAGTGTAAPSDGTSPSATSPSATSKSSSANASADSPAAAVESWVTQILQKRYKEACLASAPAMTTDQDAETLCNGPEVKRTLESLHEAWAKPGVKLPPQAKVTATGVTPQGDTVTVADTAISVDGRTLRELALIGATGNVESFSFSLEVKKHNGTWHVGDMNIKF